jgi:alkylation response protein AidB-like acyl-CoA dehydrogenase
MTEYRAPLEDIRFVLDDVVGLSDLAELPGFENADPELIGGLLEEAGKFVSEVLSPLNRTADIEGARLEDGVVVTPSGFREAYAKFAEAGWGSVGLDAEFGGGGLPRTLAIVVQEMVASANMTFGLCPALGEGAMEALRDHGSEELQQAYLPKLVPGEWSATMALTEAHAGTDLGALRCSAERQSDGSYRLRGTKIFITFGDHDLTENIIHLVLARTPDAPPGVKGISCFIVPKFLVGPDGSLGARNDVKVISLENKLGIHGSPTCVMSYGEESGAVGYLIGEENRGLAYMFTMMNRERLFVACQGLAIAERAYQFASEYARERQQGRAIDASLPPGEMSPIIDHADVRRMLLTMRSTIEAMRCLLYATAMAADVAAKHPDEKERERKDALSALLTPVAKVWLSDSGVEITSTAIQVYGGMGYVEESGLPQLYRDVRITPIYEGTNGVQALDLVTRKLPMGGGAVVRAFVEEMRGLDSRLSKAGERLADLRGHLAAAVGDLSDATEWLLERSENDPGAVAAAATPYARMFGVVTGGYFLARSALAALARIEAGKGADFEQNKLATARFFAEQILPSAGACLPAVKAGAAPLFAIAADDF